MFGYIRPLKGELKVREYESFKTVYCGLCNALRINCGFSARFLVNYDLVFMSMLLWEDTDNTPCTEHHKCPASPFRKKCCAVGDSSLQKSAFYSVILSWWKLKDTVADDGFFKSLGARISLLLLSGSYKKSRKAEPDFDRICRSYLSELSELEKAKSDSLDSTADKFASILGSVSDTTYTDAKNRELGLLLYHVGRIIYILDAVDDLKDDFEKGSYNPLIYRMELTEGKLTQPQREIITNTIAHSQGLACSAFELMPRNCWSSILENIIYLGIPWVTKKVMDGEYIILSRRSEASKS